MLRVGLLGATGFMGSSYCSGLLQAFHKGQLCLIILHRPTAETSRYPPDVERRPLDLEGDVASIRQAIQGLNVVISAVSGRVLNQQYTLIDALKDSSDLITFFPSEYASPFTDEDMASPYLWVTAEKTKVIERAREAGVPVTVLKNATTPGLLFGMPGISPFEAKKNRLQLYQPQGQGKRGLTSKAFSGAALVHLLLHRLHDLPNATFSLVEHEYSSQDLTSIFTKLHNGIAPEIEEYTEQGYQRDLQTGFLPAMRAGRMKGLAIGTRWPGEKVQDFEGWEAKSLEDWIKEFA